MQRTDFDAKETAASTNFDNDFIPEEPHSPVMITRKPLLANIGPPVSRASTSTSLSQSYQLASNLSGLMNRRWTKDLYDNLPTADQAAISRGSSSLQHAPEYSQSAYEAMLRQEIKIGNYFAMPNCQFSDM